MENCCEPDINDRSTGGREGPWIELRLGRGVFGTGRRLSGVVVLRCAKPVDVSSVSVSATGCETPTSASLGRALRRRVSFFFREVILSGREQPRRTSERVSAFWNAFLRRNTGRRLSAGEHAYPFFITLPASLPPSYQGRAGRIDYRVTARVRFPIGRSLAVRREVPVVLVPREHSFRPIALSYPTVSGAVHASETRVSLEFERRSVEIGQAVRGRFRIANPQQTNIAKVEAALEVCEWVRATAGKELQRERLDTEVIVPEDPLAPVIEGSFELQAPPGAPPTVEGTAISVMWLLKLSVDSSPPLELKAPITVYSPLEQT